MDAKSTDISRATLREIARRVDMDISTVSRALSGSPRVARKTKEEILSVAKQMDYFPNSMARGLVSRKSETIGLILPQIFSLQGPFFSQILGSIEQTAVQNGYNLLIASEKTGDRQFPFNLLRARRIDGLLIHNDLQQIPHLAELKREKSPFVLVNRQDPDAQTHWVSTDDVHGAELATKHLMDLGHRRIGVVAGSLQTASSTGRLEGYWAALKEQGLAYEEGLVQEGLFERGIETGWRGAEKLFAMKKPPTAIFAFSDELAVGVMQAARERGLQIPKDVALVGYDNIEYSAHLHPALTTVSQDPRAIGATSCQMLIDLLRGKSVEERQVRIPVKLIVRDSCGSKRKGEHS